MLIIGLNTLTTPGIIAFMRSEAGSLPALLNKMAEIIERAWELLVAMLAMEAAFGIAGVVAAPIFYAYVKAELADRGLI